MTMQHLQSNSSWPEEFFDGFKALPASKTTFSSFTEPREPKLFKGGYLKFLNALTWGPNRPIYVWRAMANGHELIVKKFNPVTDQKVNEVIKTYPEASINSSRRVKQDMDPFILEQRAYERIRQLSPEKDKAFFPTYFGVFEDRVIVLEPLRPSLRSRCVCSNSVPFYLSEDLQLLQRHEKAAKENLSTLERRWYESLFIDRLKKLTALHCIGIIHGDIKEEHFRLSNDFYDTALFDFSRAYTITSERPYMIQGYVIDSRFATRWARFRSMQKLVEMERCWTRELIYTRIEENAFLEHFNARYGLERGDFLTNSKPGELELIVMKIFRIPEDFAFPSLASLLPFLEEAANGKQPTWIISRANSLENYIAIWVQITHRSSRNYDPSLISIVSYSGESLLQTLINSPPSSTKAENREYFFCWCRKHG